MKMNSHDVTVENLLKQLPVVLQAGKQTSQLAAITADALSKIFSDVDLTKIYPEIDAQSEEILDILAQDFAVDWYDYDESIDVKRELIKTAKLVHKRLGTKWAVERVIRSYFGSGYIKEWFEYGGEPYFFRMYTDNLILSNSLYEQFLRLLRIVKRRSAWLEGIIIDQNAGAQITYGAVGTPYERVNDALDLTPRYKVSSYYGAALSAYEQISDAANLTPAYKAAAYIGAAAYHYEQVGFAVAL
jgi:phage tail P2-like protein